MFLSRSQLVRNKLKFYTQEVLTTKCSIITLIFGDILFEHLEQISSFRATISTKRSNPGSDGRNKKRFFQSERDFLSLSFFLQDSYDARAPRKKRNKRLKIGTRLEKQKRKVARIFVFFQKPLDLVELRSSFSQILQSLQSLGKIVITLLKIKKSSYRPEFIALVPKSLGPSSLSNSTRYYLYTKILKRRDSLF